MHGFLCNSFISFFYCAHTQRGREGYVPLFAIEVFLGMCLSNDCCALVIWHAGPLELQLEIEKAISGNKEAATAALDMKMKNKLANKGSQFNKELLLKGLLKPFPRNCIALMTITGAKGSTVSW